MFYFNLWLILVNQQPPKEDQGAAAAVAPQGGERGCERADVRPTGRRRSASAAGAQRSGTDVTKGL